MLYLEIKNTLEIHEIEFSLSTFAYDRPEEIYILLRFDPVAYEQAALALESIGFESELPLTPAQIFHLRQNYIDSLGLRTWGFRREKKRIQIYLTEGLGERNSWMMSPLTHFAPYPRQKKDKSINLRIPNALLEDFKKRARQLGVPYQSQIRKIMTDWLIKN